MWKNWNWLLRFALIYGKVDILPFQLRFHVFFTYILSTHSLFSVPTTPHTASSLSIHASLFGRLTLRELIWFISTIFCPWHLFNSVDSFSEAPMFKMWQEVHQHVALMQYVWFSVQWCFWRAGTFSCEGPRTEPPWAPTLSAGQSWTRSTMASWPTWWQPWTWPPTASPLLMATGPAPWGPPALRELDSQTGSCRCRRGGAASPDSPPSRPNVCPSQMLMWGDSS